MKHFYESLQQWWCDLKKIVRGIFVCERQEYPFERIVFVSGVSTKAFRVRKWRKHLHTQYPGKEIVMPRMYYLHMQTQRANKLIAQVQDILVDVKKTLVIGHSFGGMIAKAAIAQAGEDANIALLVTLASPHTMKHFKVDDAVKKLSIPQTISAPKITFGGDIDLIVPDQYTDLPDAIEHITLHTTHIGFLSRKKIRKHVLHTIGNYFSQTNRKKM